MFKFLIILSLNLALLSCFPLDYFKQSCNNENNLKECFDDIKSSIRRDIEDIKISPAELCAICNIVSPTIRDLIRKNKTEYFYEAVSFICYELKIEELTVCEQITTLFQVNIFLEINT